jgi:hypothetical protein
MQGTPSESEGTVQLTHLVLTSLDQLLLILKITFVFFTKQATLLRSSTVLSLPLQLVFPENGKTRLGHPYILRLVWLSQGALTEEEGSVWLTSSLR